MMNNSLSKCYQTMNFDVTATSDFSHKGKYSLDLHESLDLEDDMK